MERQLSYYYRNREKLIQYQRVYDKKNKPKKNQYEKEKRRGEAYNKKKAIQHYSHRHHLPILIQKYGKCQFCNSIELLEIHHKKYDRKIESCLLLCQSCHKKIHRKIYIT